MDTKIQLSLLNGWWKTGQVGKERLKKYHRQNFATLRNLLDYRQIIIVSGLRRVGKSTLLFQLMEHLLHHQIPPKNIVYFSMDDKKEDILNILEAYQELMEVDWKTEKVYVFIDEIQKLKNWSSQVKMLYDHFPQIKFFLSGSASLQLEKEAIDDLAGRYFLEEIPPLSLQEFFELKHGKLISNYQLYRNDLKREIRFFLKRPFPEVVGWEDEERVYEYIREGVLSKIVKADLPETFENVNTSLLGTLLDIFYREPGQILNADSLSRDLKIHKRTLERHLYFLEFSKLIRRVKNYRVSILSESRKLPKIYPFHIALAFSFNPELEKGKVWETAVAACLQAKNYWREGNKEIDFIIPGEEQLPLEVKSKDTLNSSDLNTLRYFLEKFKLKQGIMIYDGESVSSESIQRISLVDFLYIGINKRKGASL